LCSLEKRGLKGVKLVISDAHEGLKAAIAQVFKASWQRCRVHFMRNALAHVSKAEHSMVAAAIRSVFAQDNQGAASQTWRRVADQLRQCLPNRAAQLPARCQPRMTNDLSSGSTLPFSVNDGPGQGAVGSSGFSA
jgi:putative transposase